MPETDVLSETPLPPISESSRMNIIQKQHENLLQRSSSIKSANISSVLEFLDALAQAGAVISDPEYRSQLRDIARYWASFVNNRTGTFPIFQLQPFDESTSPNIRITDTEEPKLKGSFIAALTRYVRAYSASLVSIGIAVPIVASIVIVGLYLSSPFSPLYSVIFGILFTLVGWILVAAPYSYFTTARGANTLSYGSLTSRLLQLKVRLGVVENTYGNSEAVTQKSVNQTALRVAYTNYIRARNKLQNSSSGLLWVSGTGYINCWVLLHRAEEALIEIEPLGTVLMDAMDDKLSIQGSTIGNRAELLDTLMQSVKDLDPSAAVFFESQVDSTLKTLIQDLNENKKMLNELLQAARKDEALEQAGDHVDITVNTQEATKDIKLDTEYAEARARAALREVRRTLNDFRDHLWAGLIRARNQLLLSTALTGFVTLVLLCMTILLGSSLTNRSDFIAATAFYMIGAIAGLFGRFYSETTNSTAVDDYGFSSARLIATPLLSGLAGIGGVLIVVTLTEPVGQHLITLRDVFSLNPQYLIISAIFGLTPNLMISSLKRKAEEYISGLQTSMSAQQEMGKTRSQQRKGREQTMQDSQNQFGKVTEQTTNIENQLKELDKRIERESQKLIEAAFYYSEGSTFYRSGDNQQAIEFYLRALKLQPKNLAILERLGRAYSNLNDKDNAFKYINEALVIDPDYEPALRSLSLLYRFTEPEKAIEYLKRIVQKNPHAFEAWDFLGLCYRDQLVSNQELLKDQSLIDKAIEAHEHALAIKRRPETEFYLGILLYYSPQGDKIRAKDLLLSAYDGTLQQEHDLRIRQVWKVLIHAGVPIVNDNKDEALRVIESLVPYITTERIREGVQTHLRFLLEGTGHNDWIPEFLATTELKGP